MRSTSEASLARAVSAFDALIRTASGRERAIGADLFAFEDALDASTSLVHILTNPNNDPDQRVAVADRLLAGASDESRALAALLVRSRWSDDEDMVEALDRLGFFAYMAAAEADGAIDRVEDELFHLERFLVGNRRIRIVLSDPGIEASRRVASLAGLLGDRAHPVTAAMAERVTRALRGHTVPAALRRLVELCAERRGRLLVEATAAVPLTRAQLVRLEEILERAYGKPVQLNVTVDPDVIGGMKVQVGAQLVDATIASRLARARTAMAG